MNGTQELPPDIIPVYDLDKFVQTLTAWHANQCAAVQHMLTIPEGSQFEIGEDEAKQSVTLTGDVLVAFKLGIEMTMMQLGTLPFVAEMDDEPEATPVVPS
jgi:hypothetical protein